MLEDYYTPSTPDWSKQSDQISETHMDLDLLDRFMSRSGHIPWATRTLRLLPGPTAAGLRLRNFGKSNVEQRIKSGSASRDIFYHLVSIYHHMRFRS